MAEDSINTINLRLKEISESMDDNFLVTNGILITLIPVGFSFFNGGSVRSKNGTNIMFKNMLDFFICGFWYWLVGYTLAFGSGSSFLGLGPYIAGTGLSANKMFAHWFFQISYAATPTTIVSGALAERCHFVGFLIYTGFISGVVYPVVCHWAWTPEGWLTILGFKDFCGSGVVHMLGGSIAIVAAVVIGPRTKRFPKPDSEEDSEDFEPHNTLNVGLGAMLMFSGFLAFNGGSLMHISQPGDGQLVGKIIINTILAGTGGCIGVLTLVRIGVLDGGWGHGRWSFLHTINGGLAGMVAVCSNVDLMEIWAALLLGLLVAPVYCGLTYLVPRLKVDDPINVIPLHFGGGLWGLIGGSLLRQDALPSANGHAAGLFLAYNVIGALAIMAWCWSVCGVLFIGLRFLGLLRATVDEEIEGMDLAKHQEPAYRGLPFPPEACCRAHYNSQITLRTQMGSDGNLSVRIPHSAYLNNMASGTA